MIKRSVHIFFRFSCYYKTKRCDFSLWNLQQICCWPFFFFFFGLAVGNKFCELLCHFLVEDLIQGVQCWQREQLVSRKVMEFRGKTELSTIARNHADIYCGREQCKSCLAGKDASLMKATLEKHLYPISILVADSNFLSFARHFRALLGTASCRTTTTCPYTLCILEYTHICTWHIWVCVGIWHFLILLYSSVNIFPHSQWPFNSSLRFPLCHHILNL